MSSGTENIHFLSPPSNFQVRLLNETFGIPQKSMTFEKLVTKQKTIQGESIDKREKKQEFQPSH